VALSLERGDAIRVLEYPTMDDLRKRLERLEHRLERGQKHTERVLATQREIVEKAFDQVRLAMLEQDAAMRAQAIETRESLQELTQIVLSLEKRISDQQGPPAA